MEAVEILYSKKDTLYYRLVDGKKKYGVLMASNEEGENLKNFIKGYYDERVENGYKKSLELWLKRGDGYILKGDIDVDKFTYFDSNNLTGKFIGYGE